MSPTPTIRCLCVTSQSLQTMAQFAVSWDSRPRPNPHFPQVHHGSCGQMACTSKRPVWKNIQNRWKTQLIQSNMPGEHELILKSSWLHPGLEKIKTMWQRAHFSLKAFMKKLHLHLGAPNPGGSPLWSAASNEAFPSDFPSQLKNLKPPCHHHSLLFRISATQPGLSLPRGWHRTLLWCKRERMTSRHNYRTLWAWACKVHWLDTKWFVSQDYSRNTRALQSSIRSAPGPRPRPPSIHSAFCRSASTKRIWDTSTRSFQRSKSVTCPFIQATDLSVPPFEAHSPQLPLR